MPKRSSQDKIDYYSAKLKRLQEKKHKKQRRVIAYSSSDSENNSGNVNVLCCLNNSK